ncbi:MAG: helix-turn-helix transcriptional regulator [Acidocella sp.]|nr:helix-turn-helix transcriptional regulator [Acidocella sp.]
MNLAAWRAKKGFTQEQLGNTLNVGKSAISRWESGQRQMNIEDIENIARIFGVEPVALYLSPDNYEKAIAISKFSTLIDEIGLEVPAFLRRGH